MPNVKAMDAVQNASVITAITTAETAFITSPAVPTVLPTNKVHGTVTCELTVGTAGVTARIRVFRGATAAGTVVYTSDLFTVVAAQKYSLEADFVDQLAGSESAQYTAAITVGSATGNSTVDNAVFKVMVF